LGIRDAQKSSNVKEKKSAKVGTQKAKTCKETIEKHKKNSSKRHAHKHKHNLEKERK
jgi:hypothetical protein